MRTPIIAVKGLYRQPALADADAMFRVRLRRLPMRAPHALDTEGLRLARFGARSAIRFPLPEALIEQRTARLVVEAEPQDD